MGKVINKAMQKVIKGMVYTVQITRFLELMPQPKDFINPLVDDLVYLSSRIMLLERNINKLLDSYGDIPRNYILTQLDSITSSATNLVNNVAYNANGVIQDTADLAYSAVDDVAGVIDSVNRTVDAVNSLGSTVSRSTTGVLGDSQISKNVSGATSAVYEWTGNNFKNVSTSKIDNAINSINDAETKASNYVNDKARKVTNEIDRKKKWVEDLLMDLKKKMDKLSQNFDNGFKNVTGLSSVAKGSTYVSEVAGNSGTPTGAVASVVAGTMADVIKNFSIAKVVKAYAGVLTQSVLVRLGLDALPPINCEAMLKQLTNDVKVSNEELYMQIGVLNKSVANDIDSLAKIPPEDVEFSSSNYDKFLVKYGEELARQRDEIRLALKIRQNEKDDTVAMIKERRELESAIKGIRKIQRQVRAAKTATTLTEKIKYQIDGFKTDAKRRCNSLKETWMLEIQQYKDALQNLKDYFTNGGPGDSFIAECCEEINEDCTKIKDLCKNLKSQLIASSLKVVMPADIGTVVPNPAYKISDFIMDIKTIVTFIKDLILLVADIIRHIYHLAKVMFNGINNVLEIYNQLLDLLNIKWFFDLIQGILDFFFGKIKNVKALLSNMLAPVHYNETDEYENTLEALEQFEDGEITLTQLESFLTDKNRFYVVKNSDNFKIKNFDSESTDDNGQTEFDKFMDELDKKSDEVVAYKSPILADEDYQSVRVSDLLDENGELNSDIKFIGWNFFHPNLEHKSSVYKKKRFRKIKSKIIKKASKKSNKKSGGVNMLNRKKIKKETAYSAFYWYTLYTEDLDEDGSTLNEYGNDISGDENGSGYGTGTDGGSGSGYYSTNGGGSYGNGAYGSGTMGFDLHAAQGSVRINSSVQSENGTVVQLNDGRKVFVSDTGVRKGDYVNVNGIRYRVQ